MELRKLIRKSLRWILRLAVVAAFFLASLLIVAAWYRGRNHTADLVAGRGRQIGAEERLVADSAAGREFEFSLKDDLGRTVRGRLRLPETVARPLPAILIFGGQRTGARALRLTNLDRPAVFCALDYPDIPSYKVRALEVPGLLYRLDQAARETVGTSFGVLDYLSSKPEVDTSRITVLGASFGVPFAAITALDQRVKGLVLVYGGADLERLIDWNLRKRIKLRPLRKLSSFLLGAAASPYEPAAYIGRLAPRPLLMVNSSQDEKIPAELARKLFLCARGPKELIWLEGSHIHPRNRTLLDEISRTVSDWLVKQSLL
ncbi:MAG: hypothetical protein V1794_08885 [Candidatus Glassbacteria bacterium]